MTALSMSALQGEADMAGRHPNVRLSPDFCNGRALGIGVHLGGDFGHAFLSAGLVPIAAWRSADAQPSYDLVAALDRDPARECDNIGKAEKRRASSRRIFADSLRKGACPVETEDRPHCHHGIGFAECGVLGVDGAVVAL